MLLQSPQTFRKDLKEYMSEVEMIEKGIHSIKNNKIINMKDFNNTESAQSISNLRHDET